METIDFQQDRPKGGGCFSSIASVGIFILVGVGLMVWGWTIVQNARASASWPTTEGQVIHSEVTSSTDADGATTYSPELTYQYNVNGLSYQNNLIKYGENAYGSRRKAQEIADGYPTGARVTVFYDPQQPERSVLEPGVSAGSYIVFCIGAFFVGLSLAIIPISMIFRRRT